MITKFKLFESNEYITYDDADFDVPDFVIDYYDNDYKPEEEEDYKWRTTDLLNYVNEEEIMTAEKDSHVENYDFIDYEEFFKQYIQATYIYEKYEDLNIEDYEYKYNNDSEDFKKETKVLRDFIEEQDGDAKDFLTYVWNKTSGSGSLYSYLSGMYSDEELYDHLKYYINYEELNKAVLADKDDEEKMRYYIDEDDYVNYEKLIEEDKENIVYLYDVMNDRDIIFDENEYQELYVKEYMKLNDCAASIPLTKMIDDDFEFSEEMKEIYKDELAEYIIKKNLKKYKI